jgi:DMSO/TMAO reductase YedYZ molybdopterin-dependent catalytic subunit
MSFPTRGFRGRRQLDAPADRIPPGQYVTDDFPVLSAGPTPRIPLDNWRFTMTDLLGSERSWTWADLTALPTETVTVDIHCVTKWSKLDTTWEGVSLDTLLADGTDPAGGHVLFHSYGGYTTNLPLEDVTGGKAWIALNYDGQPLDPEHGGPARLLVPHLYFWKSAKWVDGATLSDSDRPGFWESYGYHNYGDPWREQRYQGD